MWGTTVYTDDSHLPTAAVHSGFVPYGQLMTITVMIFPAQATYLGSTQHGITSGSWSTWYGSYQIIQASH